MGNYTHVIPTLLILRHTSIIGDYFDMDVITSPLLGTNSLTQVDVRLVIHSSFYRREHIDRFPELRKGGDQYANHRIKV